MNRSGAALNPNKVDNGKGPDPADPTDAHVEPDQATEGGDVGGDQDMDFSPVEQLAMEMGWNPNHDSSSGREFVSAEQYIRRGGEIQRTMQQQIETLKRTNQQMQEAMLSLRDHQARLSEVEAGKLDGELTELQSELDAAIEDADVDNSKKLLAKIERIKERKIKSSEPQTQQAQAQAQTQTPDTQQALSDAAQTWLRENPWYGQDEIMTQYADAQSDRFRGLPESRYFSELTSAVKTMFPDRFPRQQRSASVETPATRGGNRAGANRKKYTLNDLSDEQKRLARFYEKQGVMKVDKYIEELVRIGELK